MTIEIFCPYIISSFFTSVNDFTEIDFITIEFIRLSWIRVATFIWETINKSIYVKNYVGHITCIMRQECYEYKFTF